MKFSSLTAVVVFFCSSLFFSQNLCSATEMYQWVDENGIKHFSQRPPSHMPNLQAVDIHGTPVLSGNNAQQQIASENQTTSSPLKDPQKNESTDAPLKNATACAQIRQGITNINEAGRIRARDPDSGELRFFSDEEKEAELQKLKDQERTFC